MKSCALGPIGYWQSRRNRFDLFVTVLGIFWILMHIISFGKKDFVIFSVFVVDVCVYSMLDFK
jgi:hypothetical protein